MLLLVRAAFSRPARCSPGWHHTITTTGSGQRGGDKGCVLISDPQLSEGCPVLQALAACPDTCRAAGSPHPSLKSSRNKVLEADTCREPCYISSNQNPYGYCATGEQRSPRISIWVAFCHLQTCPHRTFLKNLNSQEVFTFI